MAQAPFVIQQRLQAIALAYRNNKLIADAVLPRIAVDSSSFKYTVFTKEDAYTVPDTKVGRKSATNEIDWSATEVAAFVQDYGLEDAIPMSDIMNAQAATAIQGVQAVDPLARSTELLTSLVALDRENRVAGTVFNAATYAAANKTTLSGTGQWSDFTNSNPVSAILTQMDGLLVRPNKLVLGQAVWTQLRQHPKVVNAFYGNAANAGAVQLEALRALLELDEIIVGEAYINSAKKGQAGTYGRLWGKHALLIYQDSNVQSPTGGLTYGYTAEWGQKVAGTIDNDPNIGLRGGTRVRVGESVKEVIAAPDVAFFFQNAVA